MVPDSPVPETVCEAWLVRPPLLVMATLGAIVSSVKVVLPLAPALPARSVAVAEMTWAPCAPRVTVAVQLPSPARVAVAISVAPSMMWTSAPGLASARVPLMVWLGWLVRPPTVPRMMAGAVVSMV